MNAPATSKSQCILSIIRVLGHEMQTFHYKDMEYLIAKKYYADGCDELHGPLKNNNFSHIIYYNAVKEGIIQRTAPGRFMMTA